ncbi:gpmA1, partial [Symbiodinium pilosum]
MLPRLRQSALLLKLSSPATKAARIPQSRQLTARLIDVARALSLRAALQSWRLQVAKERAFNAMLMLPDDEDFAAVDALESASTGSTTSPSQRWHRAQRFEGEGSRNFSFSGPLSGGIYQPRLGMVEP